MKNMRKSKKGVSPVIATIIIVAIAIVMSIAVAYWVQGLGASFTRYEKIQIVSAYAPNDNTVNLSLKNTGTSAASLQTSTILINGQPLVSPAVTFSPAANTNGVTTLQPGDSATVALDLASLKLSSGTSVQVTVQTASGDQYPQVVVLP